MLSGFSTCRSVPALDAAGGGDVTFVSVLSQVARIAQYLLFLMFWGRSAFVGDKVSAL